MELIRGLHNVYDRHCGSIATIGNFDGVHRGHQAVIARLRQQADALGLPLMVITFEPHPSEYFAKDKVSARLTRLREKLLALQRYGVDYVLCLPFNAKLATLPADQFVQTILIDRLHIKYLLIGDDFHFGLNRLGDFNLLCKFGAKYGFEVESLVPVLSAGRRISSTWVRTALNQGDLQQAQLLLDHPYSMSGRVVHGDKRGQALGIPTANIYLHRHTAPVSGVFAVQMLGITQSPVPGVANVGCRPTVDGTRSLLEVHLFNFKQDIYGCYVQVDFLHKLRDEVRYPSLTLLKEQIMRDVIQAKDFFKI